MTPQELKNSILQLAIQGKLVEQRPEEGTAEELYRQIQVEKQALIREKLIKEEKELPAYDEPPFDIPDSWFWAKITDCGAFISGFTPKPEELCQCGIIPYFKVSDMNTVGNELWLTKTEQYLKDPRPKKFFLKNTIVYPKNGGAVFTNKKRILAQDSIVDLNTGGYTVIGPVDLQYIYLYFSLIDFRQCYKGTALPTIDMDKLKKRWLPLPPLAEQKRIVAKIEELLPLIDRYEQAWTRLEAFNKRFPSDMQKSLLQLAIQGKLVDQRPEEGNVEEAIASMHIKREQLIAEKKLRKEGKINKTSGVEIEIPEHWRLIPLRDLICKRVDNRGKTPAHSNMKTDRFCIDLLEISSIIPGAGINHDNVEKFLDSQTYSTLRGFVEKDDILIATVGSVGKFALMDNTQSAIAQNIIAIKCFEEVDQRYIFYLLQTPYFYQSMGCITMEAVQASIKVPDLMNVNVPLPPLAEQKRIVAKLESLLPLCDKLK